MRLRGEQNRIRRYEISLGVGRIKDRTHQSKVSLCWRNVKEKKIHRGVFLCGRGQGLGFMLGLHYVPGGHGSPGSPKRSAP